ncbi:MAG TPA: hypothetical protein VFD62_07485 [Pyrinomonadaceae bacterium]|nr:hypothetical protein [Pyrinomonadaceae bacterium]
MVDLPVACSLMPAELHERRRGLLAIVRAAMAEVTKLENGFSYRFPLAGETLTELTNLIQLEHQCCPFLTFTLTIESGAESVALELTGPPGTKQFLAETFNAVS